MGLAGGFLSKFTKADFEDADLSYVKGFSKAHIRFSPLLPRFQAAQVWLDKQIDKDMQPYIPIRTGALRREVHSTNMYMAGSGRICVYARPYGRKVYVGITDKGQPMHYTNPLSTPHWFNTVKNIYGNSWIEGAKEVVKKGSYGK